MPGRLDMLDVDAVLQRWLQRQANGDWPGIRYSQLLAVVRTGCHSRLRSPGASHAAWLQDTRERSLPQLIDVQDATLARVLEQLWVDIGEE